MAATIEIHIVGIAIGYEKNGNWNIIFPVDSAGCHNVIFKSKKGNNSEINHGSLAHANSITVEITAQGASSTTGSDQDFKDFIYNLTDSKTHSKIRQKAMAGKFVLMTIPNAYFTVRKFVPPPIPLPGGLTIPFPLIEVGNPFNLKLITTLAHSGNGTITLNDDAQVKVKVNGVDFFTTDKNTSYILTVNNDCNGIPVGKNDMDLYYQVIEEFDPITEEPIPRQFRIGGSGLAPERLVKADADVLGLFKILKDPPDGLSVLGGNTCLFAQVTDDDSIKKLP